MENETVKVTQPKASGWTEDETAKVVSRYQELTSGDDAIGSVEAVEFIATETNRKKRSVQGKLTTMGVYVPPVKAPAAKRDDGPTKKEIINHLATLGVLSEAALNGLSPCAKDTLKELTGVIEGIAASRVA